MTCVLNWPPFVLTIVTSPGRMLRRLNSQSVTEYPLPSKVTAPAVLCSTESRVSGLASTPVLVAFCSNAFRNCCWCRSRP